MTAAEYRSISYHLDCTREIDIDEFELMIEVQEICNIRNIDLPRPGGKARYPVSVLREAVQKILRRKEKIVEEEYRSVGDHLKALPGMSDRFHHYRLGTEAYNMCADRKIEVRYRPNGKYPDTRTYPVSILEAAIDKILGRKPKERNMKPQLNIRCGFVEGTLGDIIDNKDSKNPLFHLIQEAYYLGKFSGSGREYKDKLSEGWNKMRMVPVEESIPQEEVPSFDLDQIITLYGAIFDYANQMRKRGDFLEHLEDFRDISKIEGILLDMARRLK